MSELLVLVIVLPLVLLGVGVVCGLHLARLLPHLLPRLWQGRAAPLARSGTKSSEPQLHTIHVVASSAPLLVAQAGQSHSMPPSALASPSALTLAAAALPSLPDSPQRSPSASTLGYHKRRGSVELGQLMRAGTSVLSQVMDELDTRSAIMRLMSDGVPVLPSPQAGPVSTFSPAQPSIMPPGEVHMDEIDLLECIGRGGYGAVYKASWRQAPVAVKYIVCCTEDHDSLGRAIREVVLSKKMSHPNVVQCYSWTVLTEPEKAQEPSRIVGPLPGLPGSARRSLDTTFLRAQGSGGAQQSLRRITELQAHKELSEASSPASPLVPSPFVEAALGPFSAVEDAAGEASLPVLIPSKQSSDSGSGSLPVRISSKQSSDSGSRAQPADQAVSPSIPAVRPADMPVLAAVGVEPAPGGLEDSARPCSRLAAADPPAGDVHDDAETPAATHVAGSFDDIIAHFQQLASELRASRSSSLRLSHQPTGSSSFSDINNGFMLGYSSRAETQHSAPDSEFTSRQESPGSSLAVTPCAAAADSNNNNNPFRRSRLSRNTSNAAAVVARLEGGEGILAQLSEAPLVPSTGELAQLPEAGEAPSMVSVPLPEPSFLPQPAHASLQPSTSANNDLPQQPREASSLHHSSAQEGLLCAESQLGKSSCPSQPSLAAWQQRTNTGSSSMEVGPARSMTRASPPGGAPDLQPTSGLRPSFQLWRAETAAPASHGPVPRMPSRLGMRPFASLDIHLPLEGGLPYASGSDTGRSSLAALPPGSPTACRGPGQRGSCGNLAAFQEEGQAGGRGTGTKRTSPGASRGGSPLPPELLVASRENSRSAKKHQRRVDEVIDCELTIESRAESFNSEEGFGSPVRNRCGGVKSVFDLEGLHLTSQEALMVVVMEYCDLGALRKALRRRAYVPHGKWSFQTTYRALLRTAQEIAKGMEYIHDFDIVHGDLKPGNVLLKTHKVDRRGYIAKVSDFGLSRPINHGETHISMGSALGTIAYTSPETFATNIAKKPSDVYAFGIMMWEMFYCKDVYDNLLDGQICVGVSDGTLRPEFDDGCPLPYRRLAQRCWHQEPDKRPPFKEIVRELVQIEVDFRNLTHRQNSKLSTGSGNTSAANSRPASPDVLLQRSRSRAADSDFARALQ